MCNAQTVATHGSRTTLQMTMDWPKSWAKPAWRLRYQTRQSPSQSPLVRQNPSVVHRQYSQRLGASLIPRSVMFCAKKLPERPQRALARQVRSKNSQSWASGNQMMKSLAASAKPATGWLECAVKIQAKPKPQPPGPQTARGGAFCLISTKSIQPCAKTVSVAKPRQKLQRLAKPPSKKAALGLGFLW